MSKAWYQNTRNDPERWEKRKTNCRKWAAAYRRRHGQKLRPPTPVKLVPPPSTKPKEPMVSVSQPGPFSMMGSRLRRAK